MKRIHLNLLITAIALVLAGLMYSGQLDAIGERYTEEGLKRTLITYGIARGLNGVISVAQGTEVAVEPVGVGLTFTPGQILDPVNDLIERFSWIVMASGASLGIQRILIQMTAWPWFTGLVFLSLALAVVFLWRKPREHDALRSIVFRVALALLVVRLAIPTIAVVNEGIYLTFLQPQYEASQNALQRTADDIQQINEATQPPPPERDESFLDSVKSLYQSAAESMDIESQLDELSQAAAEVSENVLDMIVVFVLQTIIFPLLFLWILVKIVQSIIRRPFPIR